MLQDTHRSHLREYEKYIEDVKSSKSAIQNLENSSEQALNIKFYKSMKIYVENLIDCLNEKVHGCKDLYYLLFIEKFLYHVMYKKPNSYNWIFPSSVFSPH